MLRPALKTLLFPAAALTALLSACSDVTPHLQPQAVRHPVLFVHGWNSDSTAWTTMLGRFKNAGYSDAELFNWSYSTSQSNAVTAQQISQKVDAILAQTGASKVDIVSHSMGGLSSRYYLKNLGGGAKVDAWVSLGGPNHGTNISALCFSTACSEMNSGSAFLADLNSGDETPGTPRYATWWSPCDAVINPDSSVSVSGGTNTRTACLTHNALHEDATVFGQVKTFIGLN